ncbi:Alpha-L-arabinofuranosidase 1, partial [Bienertia sinuspersici]
EINHAGVGGLWAELVSNRGFEAGGRHSPSIINPWGAIGDEDVISITTELSSCFESNPIALRMDVHCNQTTCPPGGVGIYNPGYWGMSIEEGKSYKVVFYVKSSGPLEGVLSLASEDGTQVLAFERLSVEADEVNNWTKMEVTLKPKASYKTARLQFTTSQNGTIWLDQGHGFRTDLMRMLEKLKPKFLRFPGGCYVEGNHVRNAFRWKETVGPWEERPGHFGDNWNYWSDDGLGIGTAKDEQVDSYLIAPFVQEMLDGIEFARGSANSTWGSLRAKMGHPSPFNLKYVAVGNEACQIQGYNGYPALRKNYPDIKIISNCDASQKPLDHPADLYDYHNYTTAEGMLELTQRFKKIRRGVPHAPKAFVSEYAAFKQTNPSGPFYGGTGTFKGALAEAAFLLSLEQNRHVSLIN